MSGLKLLASYPKSGNTWMRVVLDCLLKGTATPEINNLQIPIASKRSLVDAFLDCETADLTDEEVARLRPQAYALAVHKSKFPMILKSHDCLLPHPLSGVPAFFPANIAAAIYIVRDPRDVAASFSAYGGHSIDEVIDMMADETRILGRSASDRVLRIPEFVSSWSLHVASWIQTKAANVHAVRYEDMIGMPLETFAAAAQFLHLTFRREFLAAVLDATRFSELQRQEATYGFQERTSSSAQFFRRGGCGTWREVLTAGQAKRIAAAHGAMMRQVGYDF